MDGETLEVAILLYEGMTALDAVGPYEVLSRLPNTTVKFVAKEKGLIRTDTRVLALNADYSLSEVSSPHVMLIPGGSAGTKKIAEELLVLDWIRQVHATSTWTTAVCTGTFLLGEAGLLEGIEATTHWASASYLQKYRAIYQPTRLVQSGKVITAAGVSAGIDMALYLACEMSGDEIARAIQLAIEYDPKPPFDSGSELKASKQTIQQSSQMLRSWFTKELGKFYPSQKM